MTCLTDLRFGETTLLRNSANVIYTFDYFNPDAFVFGSGNDQPQRALREGAEIGLHVVVVVAVVVVVVVADIGLF